MQSHGVAWGTFSPNTVGRIIIGLARHTILGRGPTRQMLAGVFGRHHSGPVDCAVWSVRARLYPANNRSDRKMLLRPDRFDAAELSFLRAQVQRPGAVFVDVGANSGFYSLHAAIHAGVGARIIAIEPATEVLARLTFNVSLAREAHRIDPSVRVEAFAVAVGERDGEARLSTAEREGRRAIVADGGRPIVMRSLGSLLDEHAISCIDALKIDVEGYEDRILLPYLDSVPKDRWPRLIILEHVAARQWRKDCISYCLAHGYRSVAATRSNTVLAPDPERFLTPSE